MCGICGRYNFDGKKIEEYQISRMCSLIKHRGPDDQGFFIFKGFGFGMQRLSIIDLDTGHQPIFNEDKSLVVVFNGEIYNYLSLKETLVNRGHKFKTNSDTETIIHAFEEYGEKFVTKLNGMFAIAIFDIIKEDLYLYRDRVGIKPLYYYVDNRKFIFGSELKTISSHGDVSLNIDTESLDLFLSFGFISAPKSIFSEIKKLQPAHYLKITKEKELTINKYWSLSFNEKYKKGKSELKSDFINLFSDAVKIRMQSDVPFGAFLSGGIDSSLIVALMSRYSTDPINTFSLGYLDDEYYNETKYAEIVAKKYGTVHHSFLVDSKILTDYLDLYITHFDEPFADYSAFPTYVVSSKAREYVKVVLSGDGGDEIFAGYKRYYAELIAMYMAYLPLSIRKKVLLPTLSFLKKSLKSSRRRNYIDFSLKKLKMLNLSEIERYYISSSHNFFTPHEKEFLYHNPELNDYSLVFFSKFWDDAIKNDFLGKRQWLDIQTKLPDDMLTKVDRMSMAASLETRVPFLDHRIIEFSAKIPSELRMDLFKMKKFLKDAASGFLPKEIISRRKHGFSSPIDKWFREDLLLFAKEQFITKSKLGDFVDFNYVNELLEQHVSRKANHGNKLFNILILQLWFNKYIK